MTLCVTLLTRLVYWINLATMRLNMKALILKNKLLIIVIITTVIISYYCISTIKNYFSTLSFRWDNDRAVALYLIDDDVTLRIYKNKLWYRVGFSCYSEEIKLNKQITANLNEWHISRITKNSIELNAENERKIIHYDCN